MLVTIPKIAFSLKNQMHLRKTRFITALSLRTGVSCKTPSTPACLLSAWEAGWCGRYCQSGSTVPPGLPSARFKGLWPWRVFFWNRTRGDYMGACMGNMLQAGCPAIHLICATIEGCSTDGSSEDCSTRYGNSSRHRVKRLSAR